MVGRTWETPSLEGVPLVSLYKGRVVHASKTAKQLGITTGSSLAAALTKAPDLEAVEAASPYLAASWERLVEEVSGLSLVLESPMQGRLLMELEPSDAAQLAESYKVRVGLAESVEVAVIAALISSPGKVRQVEAERQERLIDALPLYILKGLGLSQGVQERLGWLGVEQVGQLRAWKKPQVLAYLGAEGKGLLPYLFGTVPDTTRALHARASGQRAARFRRTPVRTSHAAPGISSARRAARSSSRR